MKKLAVIGFGLRAMTLLKVYKQLEMDVEVVAVYDKNKENAQRYLKEAGFDVDKVTFYFDLDLMLSRKDIDGVMVSTNCNTHTEFAIKVMAAGIPLLLEKPVSINEEQLKKLSAANKKYHTPTLVSFPLRGTFICQHVKSLVDSGKIGEIQHIEAVNNVSYGRVYYKSWYRDESITGGLFLQKATHDLDCINYFMGDVHPVMLAAVESKRVFKGDMPAGITCPKCEKYHTCPESSLVIKNQCNSDDPYGEGCSFAVDTGNHDSASIIVKYSNGVHAVYTQDFIVRRAAARRGIRLIGYEGTIEFNWVNNNCNIYNHSRDQVETFHVDGGDFGHYGGDNYLCENFIDVMNGKKSAAPLSDGILSAHMCIQACHSAKTNQFMPIDIKYL